MNYNQPRGYSMGPPSGLTLQNPAEVDSISSQAYYSNLPPQYPPPERTNYYGIDKAPPSYSQSYGASSAGGSRRSASRINPGQMPRPDRPQTDLVYHTRSGSGRRNPPTVNSIYVAVDTGNCNPRHIRPTMVAPPHSADLLRRIALPFAVHMTPFAAAEPGEEPIPVVEFDQAPPRCKRCGGYVNPSTTFLDQGHKWGCNLCEYVNIVPDWYFSALDGAKLRIDRLQRVEQIKGSVDFAMNDDLFPADSLKKENIIILAVDVSVEAVQKGFTLAAIRAIRSLAQSLLAKCQAHKASEEQAMQQRLAQMQRDPYRPMYATPAQQQLLSSSSAASSAGNSNKPQLDYRLGVMTFHSQLQFFTADPTAASTSDPVKLFVVDADDPFVPFPITSWIYSLNEQADSLFTLLDKLPELLNRLSPPPSANIDKRMDAGQGQQGQLLCPTAVIKAVHSSLDRHKQGGRLYVFSSAHATIGWGSDLSPTTAAAAQDTSNTKGSKMIFQRESLASYGTPDELLMYSCPGQTRPFLDRSRIDITSSLLETINGPSASSANVIAGKSRVSNSKGSNSNQAGKISELQAQSAQYWELSSACVNSSLCVNVLMLVGDLYRDNQPFIDTAPLADVTMVTGGRLFLIRGDLLQEEAVLRLESQLLQDMNSVSGHDAILKMRCSKGVGIEQVIGAGSFSALEEELRLSEVDSSTSTMFNLSVGGGGVTLKDEEKLHLQLACLYTTPLKQRRLRVHNLTLIVSDKPTVIYRNADIEAIACAVGRLAALKAFDCSLYGDDRHGPRAILQQTLVEGLVRYRGLCSASSPKGQLVLPESLKVLPMYTLCLLKHPVFLENPPPSMHLSYSNSTPRLLQSLSQFQSTSPQPQSPAGMGNSRLFVHASERAVELRRFAAQPMRDLINAINPRVFNLFAILDGDYFESSDNIPIPSSSLPLPPAPVIPMMLARSDSMDNESSSSLGLSLSQPPTQLLLAQHQRHHSRQEKLLALHTLPGSSAEFESDQIYVVDDRSFLWMFIGRALPQDLLDELFVLSPHNPYERPDELVPRLDTSLGRKVEAFLQLVSADCSYRPEMRVIWGDLGGGNRLLNKFSTRLVEDATGGKLTIIV